VKSKKYHIIGLGGTFDHFHAGHEKFLKFASDLSDLLVIGITNQAIAENKSYPQLIESFTERSKSVENFCNLNEINFELIKLTDSVGTTTTDNRIEALAVTTETESGGNYINQLRVEAGRLALPLHVCELLAASDDHALHSDRIRAGECDRKGFVYSQLFNQTIMISEKQRIQLAQPQGPIVDQPSFLTNKDSKPSVIILVGDSTIERFTLNNWPFHIGIFDRQIERKPAQGVTLDLKPDLVVQNPAGTIAPKLAKSIQKLLKDNFHQPRYLYVEGEEDLAAIPAVLFAPLGTIVYYGQPKQGLIQIIVSETNKKNLIDIFDLTNLRIL
jgi:pantetheine-phosphate adenylyltransferase